MTNALPAILTDIPTIIENNDKKIVSKDFILNESRNFKKSFPKFEFLIYTPKYTKKGIVTIKSFSNTLRIFKTIIL